MPYSINATAGVTYFGMALAENAGAIAGQTFYVDNFQATVVPEPGDVRSTGPGADRVPAPSPPSGLNNYSALASRQTSFALRSGSNPLKHRFLLFLCTTLACASVAFGQLSRVTVKGNQFVTEDGKPIVFRGLAASDPDKLARDRHWNRHYFEAAKSWGANIVRLPVQPSAWRSQGKEDYLKLLDQGVGWAKELRSIRHH